MLLDSDIKDAPLLPTTGSPQHPLPNAIQNQTSFTRINYLNCLRLIQSSFTPPPDNRNNSTYSSLDRIFLVYFDKYLNGSTNKSSIQLVNQLKSICITTELYYSIPPAIQTALFAFACLFLSKSINNPVNDHKQLLQTVGTSYLNSTLQRLENDHIENESITTITGQSAITKSSSLDCSFHDNIIAEIAQYSSMYGDFDIHRALKIAGIRVKGFQFLTKSINSKVQEPSLITPILMYKSFWFKAYVPRMLKEFEYMVRRLEPTFGQELDYSNLIQFLDFLHSFIPFRDRIISRTDMASLNEVSIIYRLFHAFFSIVPPHGVFWNQSKRLTFLFVSLGNILDAAFPRIISYFGHGFSGELVYWYNENFTTLQEMPGKTDFHLENDAASAFLRVQRYAFRVTSFFQSRYNMLILHSLLFRSPSNKNGIVTPPIASRNINEVFIKEFDGKQITAVNNIHIPELCSGLFSSISELQILGLEYDCMFQYNPHHYDVFRNHNGDSRGRVNDGFRNDTPGDIASASLTRGLPITYIEDYLLKNFILERERVSKEICNEHLQGLQMIIGTSKISTWKESLQTRYLELLQNQRQPILQLMARLLSADFQLSNSLAVEFNPETGLNSDDFHPAFLFSNTDIIRDCGCTLVEIQDIINQLLGIWQSTLQSALR